jgi:mono/diheme cytochrome c family protein
MAVGCHEQPDFRLNFEGKDRSEMSTEHQQKLATALLALFGTPNEPYAWPNSGLDQKKLNLAGGPTGGGEKTGGLYREHCAHCHGLSGDGLGPTARFLNPYPRDYRRGIFKFTSTADGAKPTTDDLKRTLKEGIHGTAMPSFLLLPDHEIDALAEYVKYLAIRGEVESILAQQIEDEFTHEFLDEQIQSIVTLWNDASERVVTPDPRPDMNPDELAASIERGRKLFQDQVNAQCVKCHGPTGLGDGSSVGERLYDAWNKPKLNQPPELFSLPIQELQPRNLRLGIYRGGRRKVDLYRRIFAGIKGAEMPAAGAKLKPEEIWSLVDYVQSLPYEDRSGGPQESTAVRPRL